MYIITYSADPYLDTVHSPTGYIEVPNMAAAQDTSQNVSAEAKVLVSGNMVYKTVTENAGTGNVQWTVNINEDCRDISGMTFTDVMLYAVNWTGGEPGRPYDLRENVNLQVRAYVSNGQGGHTYHGDVTDAFQELITYNEDGALTILFPAANAWPEGLKPTWGYQLIYETPFPEDAGIGNQVTFHNTAQLDKYNSTAYWQGNVPEQGYGLVKQSTDSNLNTGTDVGTVDWRSTISYPSNIAENDLKNIEYRDWIANVYYEDSGQFIDGSHYTTLNTLRNTLKVTNAQGETLVWGTDYTVGVVYADAMPPYNTFNEAWAHTETIFAQELTDVTTAEGSDTPIALFCIQFTKASLEKLKGGRLLNLSYQTLVNRQKTKDGETVLIENVGSILGHTVPIFLETAFHPQLQKQVSTTGMSPAGTISS